MQKYILIHHRPDFVQTVEGFFYTRQEAEKYAIKKPLLWYDIYELAE